MTIPRTLCTLVLLATVAGAQPAETPQERELRELRERVELLEAAQAVLRSELRGLAEGGAPATAPPSAPASPGALAERVVAALSQGGDRSREQVTELVDAVGAFDGAGALGAEALAAWRAVHGAQAEPPRRGVLELQVARALASARFRSARVTGLVVHGEGPGIVDLEITTDANDDRAPLRSRLEAFVHGGRVRLVSLSFPEANVAARALMGELRAFHAELLEALDDPAACDALLDSESPGGFERAWVDPADGSYAGQQTAAHQVWLYVHAVGAGVERASRQDLRDWRERGWSLRHGVAALPLAPGYPVLLFGYVPGYPDPDPQQPYALRELRAPGAPSRGEGPAPGEGATRGAESPAALVRALAAIASEEDLSAALDELGAYSSAGPLFTGLQWEAAGLAHTPRAMTRGVLELQLEFARRAFVFRGRVIERVTLVQDTRASADAAQRALDARLRQVTGAPGYQVEEALSVGLLERSDVILGYVLAGSEYRFQAGDHDLSDLLDVLRLLPDAQGCALVVERAGVNLRLPLVEAGELTAQGAAVLERLSAQGHALRLIDVRLRQAGEPQAQDYRLCALERNGRWLLAGLGFEPELAAQRELPGRAAATAAALAAAADGEHARAVRDAPLPSHAWLQGGERRFDRGLYELTLHTRPVDAEGKPVELETEQIPASASPPRIKGGIPAGTRYRPGVLATPVLPGYPTFAIGDVPGYPPPSAQAPYAVREVQSKD
ncbi:MAG: hypothetical protein R3F62_13160 [Planctomycetota bacterium]